MKKLFSSDKNFIKDKIVNWNTFKEMKKNEHQIEPGSPGHKATALTNMTLGLSLQDFDAQNLVNAYIAFTTNIHILLS